MNLRPTAHVLLALTVLFGIIGLWAGASWPPVWRILAGLSVLGLAWEFWRARRAIVSIRLEEGALLHLGREENLTLVFSHASTHPLSLQYQPDLDPALVTEPRICRLDVPAGTELALTLRVRATAVGRYARDVARIRIAGSLGLAWWNRRITVSLETHVVPDTLRRRGQRYGILPAEGLRSASAGHGLELHHLREYRPGDPRQTIDWKASARTGEWVTRVHVRELQLRIVVLVDAGRTGRVAMGGLDQLGHYINLTARLLEFAALHDDQVGLVVAADKVLHTIAPGNGLATVHRIRSVLSSLEPSEAQTDLTAAALAVRRMVSQRALVFLLGDLEQGTSTSPLAAAIQTLVPKHLPVAVGLVAPEVHQLAESAAADWLDPWQAAAARGWRQQLDSSAESLRKMGAIALTTTPDELEPRVFDAYRSLRAHRRAG